MTVKALLKSFWTDKGGATAIEYGLICGIVSAALIAIFGTGLGVDEMYAILGAISDALA